MCSWKIANYGVLFRRKPNSAKIYRYVYALIEKTDQASHNGIFVLDFVSSQIKIVCGIQNKFYYMKEDSKQKTRAIGKASEYHTGMFFSYRSWQKIILAVKGLILGMIVFPVNPVQPIIQWTAANRLRRMGTFWLAIIVALSHRHFVTKLWGVWNFADEKFLYSQSCRLSAKHSAILLQTEGVPVPHRKLVRTKLRDLIVNENPCHTWTCFRSDGQTARIWHCVVCIADACHRAGTRWEASADHRTNLF